METSFHKNNKFLDFRTAETARTSCINKYWFDEHWHILNSLMPLNSRKKKKHIVRWGKKACGTWCSSDDMLLCMCAACAVHPARLYMKVQWTLNIAQYSAVLRGIGSPPPIQTNKRNPLKNNSFATIMLLFWIPLWCRTTYTQTNDWHVT